MATMVPRQKRSEDAALRLHPAIYQARGFSNTMMVITSAGNVVIDTCWAPEASRHRQLLRAVNAGGVKYIILTHGHADHIGGVPLWQELETRIIAQRGHLEFRHYQLRLHRFLAHRNKAQFDLAAHPTETSWAGNYGAKSFKNVVYFDDQHEVELGGLRFEVHHTPGETPDHSTVWIPEYRAAFIGDNFYESFPNIYTLRGTPPRPALDYVASIDKVLGLRPEIVIPSHGRALFGAERIQKRLSRYRDAILYVHDAVVEGMNDGKGVYTLMREIRLPEGLEEAEVYGKIAWSVRGIYEGYAGWFDLNPSSLYCDPVSAIYPDLVRLAGGTAPILEKAVERLQQGRLEDALRLTEVALGAEPTNREALQARLTVLRALQQRCSNTNERGWLDYSIRMIAERLP